MGTVRADPKRPVEHEPIPADPRDDVAFGLRIDGDIAPALETSSGLVTAPDPRAAVPGGPPAPPTTSLAGHESGLEATARFTPDTDTSRPGPLPYSDPFSPSTAPWKRLVAFDAVNPDYTLRVDDPKPRHMPVHDPGHRDPGEDRFYGDVLVDLLPNQPTRIPSVGPGARVLHARLGVGPTDRDFEILYDGADNWFVRSTEGGRARFVFELAIAREALGGPVEDTIEAPAAGFNPRDLLPFNVRRDADVVAAAIGVPKATRRETLAVLVDYFRSFTESRDPPNADRGVYLALALSKKGVCRHRAYAFMLTALALGFPTRTVMNEAHAWVEVHDGTRWKRIDLGGAGTLLAEAAPSLGPAYAPPADPYVWPPGATRGDDLGRTGRGTTGGDDGTSGGASTTASNDTTPMTARPAEPAKPDDERAESTVTLETAEGSIARGEPVHVRGAVVAEGTGCAHVVVAISARERKTGVVYSLGEVASDAHGAYEGSIVVPRSLPVGDYELVAVTPGDARCRTATSP